MRRILLQMRIDEGGRGTVRSVSRPKADKLPLYAAFLGACDERVPQVVQVVGRKLLHAHENSIELGFLYFNQN